MELLFTVLSFLPFILLIWIANVADARRSAGQPRRTWSGLAYGLLACFYAGLVLVGLLLQIGGRSSVAQDWLPLLDRSSQTALDPILIQRIVDTLPTIGFGIWSAALAGLILLLPPVRRVAARPLPLDPARTVHGIALSLTMMVVLNMAVVLALGLDTLTEVIVAQAEAEGMQVGPSVLVNLWGQQITMAVWAVVGVGWLSRHSLSAALVRLGIVRPRGSEIVLGLFTGVSMVVVVTVLSGVAALLGLGQNEAVESLSEVLLGPLLTSLPGILTLGLAAALGEETLFRGALQPRFGLLLTTLLFAITHNNYGISFSTLIVFVVGLAFGLLRRRFNTTTSMIAHATYNSALGLLGLLALRIVEQSGV